MAIVQILFKIIIQFRKPYPKSRISEEQDKEIDKIAKEDVQIQIDCNPTDWFHELIEKFGDRRKVFFGSEKKKLMMKNIVKCFLGQLTTTWKHLGNSWRSPGDCW